MTDVDELLPEVLGDLGRQAPHDPDLAGTIRGRARRQTRRVAAVAASVAGVLVVAGLSVALTRGPAAVPTATPTPTTTADPAACTRSLSTDVLPTWARTGFSDPEPRVPHVLGARGDITAILFGPMTAPATPDAGNKILWVGRVAGVGDLVVDGSLPGTDRRVHQVVSGGPGPSGVNVPVPGCWRFDLRWGPYQDVLYVAYAAS